MRKEKNLSEAAHNELLTIREELNYENGTLKDYIIEMLECYSAMKTGLNLKIKLYVFKQKKVYTELKNYIEA
ncbi:hypothetical protein [Enterococcus faecalis]|uniref:hypothetical protein n=1 Tax=Enterococcus faecalis TaxID=1351 RepID=UPI0025B1CABC|nr:hypothetical protein [Enterococcus faecalis]MDN3185419.1 hypothetical protein [Enterococcus faecalis]